MSALGTCPLPVAIVAGYDEAEAPILGLVECGSDLYLEHYGGGWTVDTEGEVQNDEPPTWRLICQEREHVLCVTTGPTTGPQVHVDDAPWFVPRALEFIRNGGRP